MSLDLLESIVESAWGYVAFAFIVLGMCGALVMALFGAIVVFRWIVMQTVRVVRRRAFGR